MVYRSSRRHTSARQTTVLGHTYDSKAESDVALILHGLQGAGRIAAWEPHPSPFILLPRVPGQRKTTTRPFIPTLHEVHYTTDFRLTRSDGSVFFIEYKGRITKDYSLRMRLFRHVHPAVELHVIRTPDAVLSLVDRPVEGAPHAAVRPRLPDHAATQASPLLPQRRRRAGTQA